MYKNRRHIIDLLFIIALIGVFALSSLLVTVLGINIYKESFERSQSTASLRTSVFYVFEKSGNRTPGVPCVSQRLRTNPLWSSFRR
jgi:hypothetical protein